MAIEVERDYIQKWTEVYLPDHKSKIETMDYIKLSSDEIADEMDALTNGAKANVF